MNYFNEHALLDPTSTPRRLPEGPKGVATAAPDASRPAAAGTGALAWPRLVAARRRGNKDPRGPWAFHPAFVRGLSLAVVIAAMLINIR